MPLVDVFSGLVVVLSGFLRAVVVEPNGTAPFVVGMTEAADAAAATVCAAELEAGWPLY